MGLGKIQATANQISLALYYTYHYYSFMYVILWKYSYCICYTLILLFLRSLFVSCTLCLYIHLIYYQLLGTLNIYFTSSTAPLSTWLWWLSGLRHGKPCLPAYGQSIYWGVVSNPTRGMTNNLCTLVKPLFHICSTWTFGL